MFLSMGNIGVNPNVGMLFIDFERGRCSRFASAHTQFLMTFSQ